MPANTWSGVFDAWIQGDAQAFAAMLCDEMLKELQVDGAQGAKRKQQVDNVESTNRKRRRNTKLSPTPKKILFSSTYMENRTGNAAACRVSGSFPGGNVASQEKLRKQENIPLKSTVTSNTKTQCPELCRLLLVLNSSVKNGTWTEIERLAVLTLFQIQQPRRSETTYIPPDCWA